MRVRAMAFLCAVSLLLGCTTTASYMASWVGRQDTELISKWGAPARETTLSDSGRVLTWVHRWTDRDGSSKLCEQSFTISKAGTVRQWAARECQPFVR